MSNKSFLKISLQDLMGIQSQVQKSNIHIKAALNWIILAQNSCTTGGVSTGYVFLRGWLPENIETTGYIISTLLEASVYFKDRLYAIRANKMAKFLVEMQTKNGGFRTVTPSVNRNSQPTVFNTGQDVIGMVDIYNYTKEKKYYSSLVKAADFLLNVQNKDGTWIRYSYDNKSHAYDTRVGYALLKAYKTTGNNIYLKGAIKNLDWAISLQHPNGWFEKAELPHPNPPIPYTHTIAYVIEGLLFSGIETKKKTYLFAAEKAADALLRYYEKNNFMPGTFNKFWKSDDNYSCVTGNAQISGIWLRLYKLNKEERYLNGARKMNDYLKSCQTFNEFDENINGGIKGSQPVYGDLIRGRGYCRMSFINWGVKFFLDALLLEELYKHKRDPKYI